MTEPNPSGPLPPTPLPVWLRVIGAIVVVVFFLAVMGAVLIVGSGIKP